MYKENYVINYSTEFSLDQINKFKEIVLSTGEITENTFDGLMNKKPIILFYPNLTEIQAIGALKIPNDTYKNRVFEKSKSQYKPTDFIHELGWVVSLNKEKGIGKLITKALSDFLPKMYATVRTENIGMNKILTSLGFEKTGNKYKSSRGNYYNFLYIKNK